MGLFDIFRRTKVGSKEEVSSPSTPAAPHIADVDCPVCGGPSAYLDTVDFNKSCEDRGEMVFAPAGRGIAYHLCSYCKFCFAPEMHAWTPQQFSEMVYNDDYVKADPDYVGERPLALAGLLNQTFGGYKAGLRHLDYGSGSGILSKEMQRAGWNSTTYDPFVHTDVDPASLGHFDFITAFEVFEHVPDVHGLYSTLLSLLAPGGLILYSTALSDVAVGAGRPLDWWYASPRNGHISLFSSHTIGHMLALRDLRGMTLDGINHVMHRGEMPAWAQKALAGPKP